MFDEKEIDAYKSIKAPYTLRDSVMAAYDLDYTPKHILSLGQMRVAASFAACVILIVTFSVFALKGSNEFSASFNGAVLSEENISLAINQPTFTVADARSLSTVAVPLKLDIHKDTRITVNNGILQVTKDKTGEVLSDVTEFNTDSDVTIYWEVIINEAVSSYEMTASDKKNEYVITLAFDDTASEWTICCEKLN